MNDTDKLYTGPNYLIGYLEGAIIGGKREAEEIERAMRIPAGKSDFWQRMDQIEQTMKQVAEVSRASLTNPAEFRK